MSQQTTVIGRTVYPRGAYVAGTVYKKFNIVTHNGCVFMALQDNPATEPSATYDAEHNTFTVSNGWLLWAFGYTNAFAQSMNTEFTRQLGLINANKAALDEFDTLFGKYVEPDSQVLAIGQAGKYVGVTGQIATDADFAISEPIHLRAGNVYLFHSTDAVGAAVSLFAKKEEVTDEIGINYTYTYDNGGKPLTARADYDNTLVYTFHYTQGTEGEVLDRISDKNGATVAHIPMTRVVQSTKYTPLFFSGDTLPESGYYIYLAIENEDVVVSGYTDDIDGATLVGDHYDIFTALAYALEDRVDKNGDDMAAIAALFAEHNARTEALENLLKNGLPKLKVGDLIVEHKVDDFSYKGNANLSGEGAPNFIPDKIGQKYLDSTNRIWYISVGNKAASDWVTYQNVLEAVKVNGTALEVSNKGVNIIVPTAVSQLSDAADYAQKEGDEFAALAAIIVEQESRISAMENALKNGLAHLAVDDLEVRNRLDDFSTKGNANISGAGAPNFIPDKVGQRYLDTTNGIYYTATGNTAVNQWKQDTNS